MPPKKSNVKPEYKKTIKLDLEKLKNGDIQNVKVDLTKINIRQLAKKNRCYKWRGKQIYVSNQFKEILCFKWSDDQFVNER